MLLYKTRCPKCAEENKDRHKDNLAIYENGAYCFSCGYHESKYTSLKKEKRKEQIFLPDDVTFQLPAIAKSWLNKYEITDKECLSNKLCFSSSKYSLIFPIWIEDNLEAWQGRYFGDNEQHPKWVSYGIDNKLYYILRSNDYSNSTSLLVAEDIVSAIKVSRFISCMPLFNAHISKQRLQRIYELGYKTLYIWLDPDKRIESVRFADLARLYGLEAKVIFSDKDPKEHDESFILDKISS